MPLDGGIPDEQIAQRQIERAIRSGIELRSDPVLILDLAIDELIAGGAIRDDIRLTDDSGRLHFQRPKQAFGEDIAVEFSRSFVDY